MFDVAPDFAFDRIKHCGEHDQEQDHFHAKRLAGFKLWLCCPVQERGHITCMLFFLLSP